MQGSYRYLTEDARPTRTAGRLWTVLVFVSAMLHCSLGGAITGRRGDAATLRFVFVKGQKLTYEVTFHTLAHAGFSPGDQVDVYGRAVLHVMDVGPDGTARIELVTRGIGRGVMRSQPTEGQSGSQLRLVLTVRPDGSLAQVQDAAGHTATFVTLEHTMDDAVMSVRSFVGGTYTVFGLRLPKKLPPIRGTWIGYRQFEMIMVGDEQSEPKVELRREAVTYTFVGRRQYKGRSCLVFAAKVDALAKGDAAATFYFDGAKGQLVGSEIHGKSSGPEKRDFDESAILVKAE